MTLSTRAAGSTSTKTATPGIAAVLLVILYVALVAPWSSAQQAERPLGIWAQVNTGGAVGPAPRDHAAMAFVPAVGSAPEGRTILFGGTGVNGTLLGDTWIWDGEAWIDSTGPGALPARAGAAMAFDGTRLILFGGQTVNGLSNDLWYWDSTLRTWAPGPTLPATPEARRDAGIAWDQARNRVVLFGGSGRNGPLADTWLWDGSAQVWTKVPAPADPATAPPAPSARRAPAMTYNDHPYPERRHVVLFGGTDGVTDFGDTWLWDGSRWTARSSPPGPRADAAMAFDPKAQSTVLFGGRRQPAPAPGQQERPVPEALGDTWVWNGETWAPGNAGFYPRERFGAAMAAFPPALARTPPGPALVLFGGHGQVNGPFNDTWTWDGTEPRPTSTTSSTTPVTSSTTSTTVAPGFQNNGDGFGGAAAGLGEAGSGGNDLSGGTTGGGGDSTGGLSRAGDVDTSGAFESSQASDTGFGFTPGAAGNSGVGGAAAVTGLAAAPGPPVPAGATPPPAPVDAFVTHGGAQSAGPVGAAHPGAAAAPRPVPGRFLMVGAGDPAALALLGGAGLMFAVFCFQLARRPHEAAIAYQRA